ncbi:MAG: potassium/proton antiporter, partial [Bauldia sp.]
MSLTAMYLAILIGAVLVTVAIFTSVISFRLGAPLLLVFLIVGLAAGEDGFGIMFDDGPAAYFIGSLALALILLDSGFTTPITTFRSAALPALSLATIGVLLTAGLAGVASHYILGLDWMESFLLGAILSSTDAAAVFFLLRAGGINLRERVRATLEVESSSNDPMAIFLTIALVELIEIGSGSEGAFLTLLLDFIREIGFGAVLGFVGGQAIRFIIDRTDLDSGLYPIIFLSLGLAVFGATSLIGGSGFLAVYIAGLIAGNTRMRHAPVLRRFTQALTWLSQIAMFLTLGLLASPSEFPEVLLASLGIAAFLMLVARPVAVWLCLLPFRFSRNEVIFTSWVGLRGAVSILLGIVPMIAGMPEGHLFFNVAFIVVMVSLLIQGWSISPVARWLKLIVPPQL